MYNFQVEYTGVLFVKKFYKLRKKKTIIKLLSVGDLLNNNNWVFKYIFI